MIYFIAWIIVGACCYLLGKLDRDTHLPKYHAGMVALRNQHKANVTPLLVHKFNFWIEVVTFVLSMVVAPLVLYFEVRKVTFGKEAHKEALAKCKALCDEFSKKHGIIF